MEKDQTKLVDSRRSVYLTTKPNTSKGNIDDQTKLLIPLHNKADPSTTHPGRINIWRPKMNSKDLHQCINLKDVSQTPTWICCPGALKRAHPPHGEMSPGSRNLKNHRNPQNQGNLEPTTWTSSNLRSILAPLPNPWFHASHGSNISISRVLGARLQPYCGNGMVSSWMVKPRVFEEAAYVLRLERVSKQDGF